MTTTQPNQKVIDFFIKVTDNKALSKELETIEEPENIIVFAHRQGYDFTIEELKTEVAKVEEVLARQKPGELSDEDLDGVVGGATDYLATAEDYIMDAVHAVGKALVKAGKAIQRL